MVKITVYPIEGGCYEKEIDGSLESMQEIVGGLIETVHTGTQVIIVDEEGLCKGKQLNYNLAKLAGNGLVGQGFVISREDWEALA